MTSTRTCWCPIQIFPSGTEPLHRSGRSRTWASGGGISSRESRATSRPTTDGPAKGTMLKGPWRKLDERFRKVWLYGAGERVIVHHWKSRRRSGRTPRSGKVSPPSSWAAIASRPEVPPGRSSNLSCEA